jgi:hypothetical protein
MPFYAFIFFLFSLCFLSPCFHLDQLSYFKNIFYPLASMKEYMWVLDILKIALFRYNSHAIILPIWTMHFLVLWNIFTWLCNHRYNLILEYLVPLWGNPVPVSIISLSSIRGYILLLCGLASFFLRFWSTLFWSLESWWIDFLGRGRTFIISLSGWSLTLSGPCNC